MNKKYLCSLSASLNFSVIIYILIAYSKPHSTEADKFAGSYHGVFAYIGKYTGTVKDTITIDVKANGEAAIVVPIIVVYSGGFGSCLRQSEISINVNDGKIELASAYAVDAYSDTFREEISGSGRSLS